MDFLSACDWCNPFALKIESCHDAKLSLVALQVFVLTSYMWRRSCRFDNSPFSVFEFGWHGKYHCLANLSNVSCHCQTTQPTCFIETIVFVLAAVSKTGTPRGHNGNYLMNTLSLGQVNTTHDRVVVVMLFPTEYKQRRTEYMSNTMTQTSIHVWRSVTITTMKT